MIHRYQKKGLNFVLDVNSGAVHLLDDISYAVSGLLDENMGDTCPQSIIDALPDYIADEIREAYDELYELKKAGQLFAQDDYIDVSRYIPVNAPVKALCLHVAHDCNLRCKYCFASTGDFGQGRKIMPPDIAKKAIDFVIARSGVRHNIEVDFFGGEPLMAWDTV
ncbi:MAG: 4Fe-4S cluster-binding domain-containing protein, partial [Butyricicoccus sp.]